MQLGGEGTNLAVSLPLILSALPPLAMLLGRCFQKSSTTSSHLMCAHRLLSHPVSQPGRSVCGAKGGCLQKCTTEPVPVCLGAAQMQRSQFPVSGSEWKCGNCGLRNAPCVLWSNISIQLELFANGSLRLFNIRILYRKKQTRVYSNLTCVISSRF